MYGNGDGMTIKLQYKLILSVAKCLQKWLNK